jgi:predicted GNAT family acetyltransferase
MINRRAILIRKSFSGVVMEAVRFEDPLLFQEQIEDYLVRYEAENNLILGILANIIAGEYQDVETYQLLIRDKGQVQAVALCTPPYPVLLSYQLPSPGDQVLNELLTNMQAGLSMDFTGLAGNKEFVTPLVKIWEDRSGKAACLEMSQRIYQLEQVQMVADVPGTMRMAERGDQQLLLKWYAEFHRDAMGSEPDPGTVDRQVENYLKADSKVRGLTIWEVSGRPVSMAGYSGPTPNGIRVGAVYTPPDQRRKGYASACTARLSQHLLDQGFKFCFLFTDLLNPTSNHIYQQIGYRPVCDVDRHLF